MTGCGNDKYKIVPVSRSKNYRWAKSRESQIKCRVAEIVNSVSNLKSLSPVKRSASYYARMPWQWNLEVDDLYSIALAMLYHLVTCKIE